MSSNTQPYLSFYWINFWNAELHAEPTKILKMEFFAKIVNHWKLLIIFTKSSVLDVWVGSEYISELV